MKRFFEGFEKRAAIMGTVSGLANTAKSAISKITSSTKSAIKPGLGSGMKKGFSTTATQVPKPGREIKGISSSLL